MWYVAIVSPKEFGIPSTSITIEVGEFCEG
jgi:hypothetical protein